MEQGLVALDVRDTKLGRAAASGICDTHKPHGFDTKHVHALVIYYM